MKRSLWMLSIMIALLLSGCTEPVSLDSLSPMASEKVPQSMYAVPNVSGPDGEPFVESPTSPPPSATSPVESN